MKETNQKRYSIIILHGLGVASAGAQQSEHLGPQLEVDGTRTHRAESDWGWHEFICARCTH